MGTPGEILVEATLCGHQAQMPEVPDPESLPQDTWKKFATGFWFLNLIFESPSC